MKPASKRQKRAKEEFAFPPNIKQIGVLEDGIRIYMEDYVHTYLHQFAKAGVAKEKLGALIGRHLSVSGQPVLMISGAIGAEETFSDSGFESFSLESWDKITKASERFFPELSVVGWVHAQPGYGAFLMAKDEEYHRENFPDSHQVLYVMDPLENMDAFFIYENGNEEIRGAKGYFIYYDKNPQMQEYMISNPIPKARENKLILEDEPEALSHSEEDSLDTASKIRSIFSKKDKEKALSKEKSEKSEALEKSDKGSFGSLLSVGGVMILALVLMGAGLLRSTDRIRGLESQVSSIQTAYTELSEGVNEAKMSAAYSSAQALTEAAAASSSSDKPLALDSSATESAPETSAASLPEELPAEVSYSPAEAPAEPAKPETKPSSYANLAYADIPEYYIVKSGDVLRSISRDIYGNVSMVDKIVEANGLESADKIFEGQKLVLPSA